MKQGIEQDTLEDGTRALVSMLCFDTRDTLTCLTSRDMQGSERRKHRRGCSNDTCQREVTRVTELLRQQGQVRCAILISYPRRPFSFVSSSSCPTRQLLSSTKTKHEVRDRTFHPGVNVGEFRRVTTPSSPLKHLLSPSP
jgi:hypothetical protein